MAEDQMRPVGWLVESGDFREFCWDKEIANQVASRLTDPPATVTPLVRLADAQKTLFGMFFGIEDERAPDVFWCSIHGPKSPGDCPLCAQR